MRISPSVVTAQILMGLSNGAIVDEHGFCEVLVTSNAYPLAWYALQEVLRTAEGAWMQLETPNDVALDMADAELAHATLLTTEGATCVAVRNDEVAITRERGVKPLLQWISEGRSFEGWSVADKVVGKAPALLYVQLKPAVVYAIAMSEAARDILLANGIACGCEDLVPFIVNRAGDGQCPMDASVTNISDPREAERAIRECARQMAASRK